MDTSPVTANHIGRIYKINGHILERCYKEHLSDYRTWDQLDHADEWVLQPMNMGTRLSIDETMVHDELLTIVSNKDGHGRKGSIVAVVRGTNSLEVIEVLLKLPEQLRRQVEEITMDYSDSMRRIATASFPNATICLDCFHIMMNAGEGLEAMRLKLKRKAVAQLKRQEKEHKKRLKLNAKRRAAYRKKHPVKLTVNGKKRGRKAGRKNQQFEPELLANGETLKDLLTHVRYALVKSREKWSCRQKDRMEILFNLYPKIKEAYNLVEKLRAIFRSNIDREKAREKIKEWSKEVSHAAIRELITVRDTVMARIEHVLNYFINRSTNASAESLNSKIKQFRAQVRGVTDYPFFLYRIIQILG